MTGDTLADALEHQARIDATRAPIRADYERAQLEDDGWITVYVSPKKDQPQ